MHDVVTANSKQYSSANGVPGIVNEIEVIHFFWFASGAARAGHCEARSNLA